MTDPPAMANTSLFRLLLRQGTLSVRYAGDRMAPAVRHGDTVRVRALSGGAPVGSVLLAAVEGAPDLLRVQGVENDRVLLRGDADPAAAHWVEREAVIGLAALPVRHLLPGQRALHRAVADLREALRGAADRPDEADVRVKYETQAPFYEASNPSVDSTLLAWMRGVFAAGGRVLVAGSGVGTECFALAEAGYQVCGVDFAPAMLRAAREGAARRGLAVRFLEGDLREHREPPGSLAGILFTYDVYSFLADPEERVSLLRRMAAWLAPGGAILLSARRVRGAWARAVLSVQWLAGGGRRSWGGSHTRWLSARGELRRSFVQVFSSRRLRREWEAAGLQAHDWRGGHGLLSLPEAA